MYFQTFLGSLLYFIICLIQYSIGETINRYDVKRSQEKYKREASDSLSSIKQKYYMRSTALNSSLNEILTSEKFSTRVECAGLCLANEQCYAFQWEESDFKCLLMKQDGICYSDDPTQSTSVYVDQFDPLPVYMECNQHQPATKGWNILLSQTTIGGPWVNSGTPIPARFAFYLENEDTWIVGVKEKGDLKMVKLKVTGTNTFDWISSKHKQAGSCGTSFSESCFNGNDVDEDKYQVQLVAEASLDCPISFISYNGNCYKFMYGRLKWEDAKAKCQEIGSGYDLVEINDKAENDFLKSHVISWNSKFWFGLSKNEGSYTWVDGSELTYGKEWKVEPWRENKPSSISGNGREAVRFNIQGEWTNDKINKEYRYICEGSANESKQETNTISGCTTALVGSSSENSKIINIDPGFTCPASIDKSNWLDGHTYRDTFSVTQAGTTLTVTRTDSSNGWGMDLKFKCCEACTGIITKPDVAITHPNFPNFYDSNSDCQQVIRFDDGTKIVLEFLVFKVEQSEGCSHDWLEIRDGGDESSPMIGEKLCGDDLPDQIISTSNELFLKFHSDNTNENVGFKIKVQVYDEIN